MQTTNTASRLWRCGACDAVLGRVRRDVLEVRIKGAAYEIVGSVRARCRRCGACSDHAPGASAD